MAERNRYAKRALYAIISLEGSISDPRSARFTRVVPGLVPMLRYEPFLQSKAMLPHLDLPSRSSHSMRSVDRTLGLLDFVKSERLAIRDNTLV